MGTYGKPMERLFVTVGHRIELYRICPLGTDDVSAVGSHRDCVVSVRLQVRNRVGQIGGIDIFGRVCQIKVRRLIHNVGVVKGFLECAELQCGAVRGDILHAEVKGLWARQFADAEIVDGGGRIIAITIVVVPYEHHLVVSGLCNKEVSGFHIIPSCGQVQFRTVVEGNPAGRQRVGAEA